MKQIETICAHGYGLADLWELSPVRIEDNEAHTEEIIDRLFPGDPLLCCGSSQFEFDTKPRASWRGELSELQFIVPSPMSALIGLTQEGKPSAHSLNNTGPRRFLVIEFDFSILARDGRTETKFAPLIRNLATHQVEPVDMCAALLVHLAQYAPLVCGVHSGGKSLHGWFYVQGRPEERVHRFMDYAVSLGADPITWSKCQFVRMPDGKRENGRRQTVFFLHYLPLELEMNP